jgi:hypothetical protein
VRRFILRRTEDINGVSGTGIVVEGVQFSDGACAIRWVSAYPSTTHHDSIDNVVAVHGHEGRTVVEWIDPDPETVVAIPVKLGWSNADTGPENMRLYALDAGDSPRWAKPHARVAETAIRETRAWIEGARGMVLINLFRGGPA